MRFAFIEAEKAVFPIELMCEVLQVSRSGYYAWLRRPRSRRETEDRHLARKIAAIHVQHRGRYGSPRILADLRDDGIATSRRRVARLMRQQELKWCRTRRFRVTTDSDHALAVAPNVLDRNFSASAPDRAWVGDMTYIWTGEGWLYLAVILDLYSRKAVGWSMGERLSTKLATDALEMAIARRRPAPGLLHHTDRGCQYASRDYRRRLEKAGMVCSMSRTGNCWDNAVAESFFATLKGELLDGEEPATRDEARRGVFEYIEGYYNVTRRHSTLGNLSPVAFERRGQQEGLAS